MIDVVLKDEDVTENDGNQVQEEIIDAFARCLLPMIQAYYDTDMPRQRLME